MTEEINRRMFGGRIDETLIKEVKKIMVEKGLKQEEAITEALTQWVEKNKN